MSDRFEPSAWLFLDPPISGRSKSVLPIVSTSTALLDQHVKLQLQQEEFLNWVQEAE